MVRAELLSDLLLELYAGCNELPMQSFLVHALELVRHRLPFDSAWWAMTTQVAGETKFHASLVQGLPPNMHDLWRSIQHDEVIGHAVQAQPDRTLNFTPVDVDSTAGSRWLAQTTGFRHVLCTVNYNRQIGQQHFLALSRHRDDASFSEDERVLKQLVMPHLHATLNINRVAELRRLQTQGSEHRSSMAVVDRLGAIHTAEPGFVERLMQQWPKWWGALVPQPLLKEMQSKQTSLAADALQVSWTWLGDLALVEIAPRSLLEQLSQREREVALRYSGGASYKEVARELGLSPATVRHHLRRVYDKLGVKNKASMVTALGPG